MGEIEYVGPCCFTMKQQILNADIVRVGFEFGEYDRLFLAGPHGDQYYLLFCPWCGFDWQLKLVER